MKKDEYPAITAAASGHLGYRNLISDFRTLLKFMWQVVFFWGGGVNTEHNTCVGSSLYYSVTNVRNNEYGCIHYGSGPEMIQNILVTIKSLSLWPHYSISIILIICIGILHETLLQNCV